MSRLFIGIIFLVFPVIATGFHRPFQTSSRQGANKIDIQSLKPSAFHQGRTADKYATAKEMNLNMIHTISLDTAVLSGSKFGLQKLGFCILLMTLAGSRLLKSLSSESQVPSGKGQSPKSNGSVKNIVQFFIKSLANISVSLVSSVLSTVGVLKNAAKSVVGGNSVEEDIKLDDWNVCKLQQREVLFGGRYTRYRFELENTASKMPLYIGQEVGNNNLFVILRHKPHCAKTSNEHFQLLQIVMCSTDSKGRILKESFFPISSTALRGYFEILVKRNTGVGAYDKFVRSLDGLEEGDEIAFKGGSYRLNYEGADDPIKYVTVVSTGLGIAPSLQILNGILSDRESTVEDMEVLWMNSDNRDFPCDNDIALLEKKYEKKLFVTRVNESKLLEQDFTQKDVILGALSAYETGRIAVLCGSEDATVKMKELLLHVGYPVHSILTISS
jgi:hypothetical protein